MLVRKSILLSAVLLAASSFSYALQCNFPQHFTVKGQGAVIHEVETARSNSDLSVTKTSDTAFEVADNTNCTGNQFRAVKLRVGTDNAHRSEIVFIDNQEGKLTIVQKEELNRFMLTAVNKLNATDYELVYESK